MPYVLVLSEEDKVLGELEFDEPGEQVLLHLRVEDVDDETGLGQLGLVTRAVLKKGNRVCRMIDITIFYTLAGHILWIFGKFWEILFPRYEEMYMVPNNLCSFYPKEASCFYIPYSSQAFLNIISFCHQLCS